MITDILVGYSESRLAQVALEQAIDIGENTDARIQLLTAVEEAEPGDEANLVSDSGDDLLAYVDAPSDEEPEAEIGLPAFVEGARLRCEEAHIACAVRRFHGEPARRLREQARLAQLVVIGRHCKRSGSERRRLGRTAYNLLSNPPAPMVVTGEEYRGLSSGLLLYAAAAAGGRALNVAGELAGLLNASLDLIAPVSDRRKGQRMVAEARFAVRPYHLDGDCEYMEGSAREVLLKAGMERHYDFVVVPVARHWWSQGLAETVRAALEIPDTVVVAVP